MIFSLRSPKYPIGNKNQDISLRRLGAGPGKSGECVHSMFTSAKELCSSHHRAADVADVECLARHDERLQQPRSSYVLVAEGVALRSAASPLSRQLN